MKHISLELLSDIVVSRRKTMKLSQTALSKRAGINRSIISRLEAEDYSPSVDQLLSLAEVLDFNISDVIVDEDAKPVVVERQNIVVAGTGYVGLSLAILLSQHNDVTAVDILPEKVAKINAWESPIQDDYIEKYMAEHEERNLSLRATTDAASASKPRYPLNAKMRKFINYCKESYVELTKKVSWPTWSKLQSSALLVMVVTVILALVLFVIDFAFEHLMTAIYTL